MSERPLLQKAALPLVTDLGPLDVLDAVERLRGLGTPALLDSAMRDPALGRWSYFAADPFARIEIRDGVLHLDGDARPGDALANLRDILAPFRTLADPALPPFQGGAIGFFGYEFGRALERLPAPPIGAGSLPDAAFGLYDWVIAWDHATNRAVLVSTGFPETEPTARAARAVARRDAVLARLAIAAPSEPESAPPLPWSADESRASYEAKVARSIEYVLAGDIFETNIAQRFSAPLPDAFSPWALYRRLRAANPATFAAFLDFGRFALASSSPERFVKLEADRVEARPIKGTAPRSADPKTDRARAAALEASIKDRAENVMIVDLLRNDLSRVCRPHSVEVPVLCGLESYATVHHLVSVVTGRLESGRDGLDLIRAAFPGGSITGAPKVRAMEIITEMEGRARGPYCGSIGYLGFDGAMDLNIAIRTVTLADGEAVYWAGGAITALSDPADEYEETLVKARRVLDATGRP